MSENWPVVLFTLEVAVGSTAVILLPGILMAWALSRPRWPGKALADTLVSLPLVLPPTALGLGLLLLLSPTGPLGGPLRDLAGWDIAFTWRGVVVASSVVSFPLLVRQARLALEEIDPELVAVARTLGRSPLRTFVEVQVPLAWRGILAGAVLAFTRALGEFGATILLAGNIPGRTQTLALALFQRVQVGREREALELAGISAALAFVTLFWVERGVRRRQRTLET